MASSPSKELWETVCRFPRLRQDPQASSAPRRVEFQTRRFEGCYDSAEVAIVEPRRSYAVGSVGQDPLTAGERPSMASTGFRVRPHERSRSIRRRREDKASRSGVSPLSNPALQRSELAGWEDTWLLSP